MQLPRLPPLASPIALALAVLWTFPHFSCLGEDNPNACETPGENRECTCPNGRGSLQTCNAFAEWGGCYCNEPVCGDGDLDMGEQCDDGNNAVGDGCSADCESEDSSNGTGNGSGPGSGGSGAEGGSGAQGGSGAAGGVGGAIGGMGGAIGGMGGGS